MLFKELAKYLEKLEGTSSRISITKILADLFNKSSSEEIDKITYLVLGQLASAYEGIVFNMADKMVIRAISEAYRKDNKEVTQLYKKLGDLGEVACSLSKLTASKKTLPSKNPSVLEVYEKLLNTAGDEGENSQERKVKSLAELFSSLDFLSVRFVARIPLGKLRLGFSDKTVLDALSWMIKGDKSMKPLLERAYQVLPDVGLIAKKVKKEGLGKAVRNIKPVVGAPVLPMLAQRIKSPEEMIEKMGKVSVEPKLDGLRLSLHFKRDRGGSSAGQQGFTKAFTRNLNDNSWMFPELKEIGSYVKADNIILDCEAVGLDEETKQLANFQATMTRRRKHEIGNTLKKVGIKFFVFDILSKDGENLMRKTYLERRRVLESTIEPGKNFKIVDYELTSDPKKIEDIYKKDTMSGYEGIMVKKADAFYVPGRTGWRWVKMKQVEKAASKLADTLDLIVMGYSLGKGKRVGFGVGQFLAGVKDGRKVKTTTKVGTGLTDERFREIKERLGKLEVKDKPKVYEIHKNYTPDYWVKPSLVVEVAADEITKSPTHSAGLALRFPRLIRFRDDKSPNEATTLGELNELFKIQKE